MKSGGKYKTVLIPPLMEWETGWEGETDFCRQLTRATAAHTQSDMQIPNIR